MAETNLKKATDLVTEVLSNYSGDRATLMVDGAGRFYRNNQFVSSFDVLSEWHKNMQKLDEAVALLLRYSQNG